LGRLGKQAVQIDPTLEPLVEGIVDLTKYAWLLRYPGDPVGPTAEVHRTRWAEHGGFRLRSWRGCRTTPTHHRHEAISPGERLA
jgi:hypothetical protein